MRRIISAISVLALAFSLVASATSANAAVPGYDSAYAGESSFLTRAPGQTGEFTVFFANTGATAWTRGTASQVDLAACLEDKTTCNAQDATEAPFNSGWLSATRYATHSQTTVAPGGIGTFTYNVAVPAGTVAGTYRFNGALVLSATGADIRNEGYYQDVTVTAAAAPPAATAATVTSMTPVRGSVSGGTPVTITGTNFACTPAFPTVNFGANAGTVTSCGATSLVVTSPAGAAGAVDVTVTNSGAAASNALTFTYADTSAPTFDSVSQAGGTSVATLTFNESICNNATFAAGDFTVTVNGVARTTSGARTLTGTDLFATALCTGGADAASTAGVTSFLVSWTGGDSVAGDLVAVTITGSGFPKIQDRTGNRMAAAQTRTTNATADTTAPSISTAVATTDTRIRLTYTEPVVCGTANGSAALADFLNQFTATVGGTTKNPTSATCAASSTFGSTRIDLNFASTIGAGGSLTYVQSTTPANRVKDLSGNNATSPQTVGYTAFAADTTAPTLTDTRIVTNAGFTTNMDSNDVFTITFSEAMDTTTVGDTISVSDTTAPTPLTGTITCGVNATCVFNTTGTAGTILTVTINGTVGGGAITYPATITGLGGFADTGGNGPNLAGSADRVIDVE